MDLLNIIVNGLTAFGASLGGAFTAFWLESRHRSREIKETRVANAKRVLFALIQQRQTLLNLKKTLIDEIPEGSSPTLAMRPTLPINVQFHEADLSSLDFLLGGPHSNLLNEAMLAQMNFFENINWVNVRSDWHIKHVQRALAEIGYKPGSPIPTERAREIIGPDILAQLEYLTNAIIDNIPDTISMLEDVETKLIKAMKEAYPDARLISMKLVASPSAGTGN